MKLSIIVPTRNGERYIEETIRSITDQLYYSVEIIVSINKSKDNTKEVVKKIKDERVRVIEPPYSLSMTKHYEFCISQAVGEWVTIIGDDDGLISNFFENFEKIIAYDDKTDVIMTNRCHYFWEGIRGEKRVLVYNNKNIKRKLNKYSIIFQSLIGMKSHLDLPKMYTGNIIKRELIEEIKLKSNGDFYHEVNPDVYSGIVICLIARQILFYGGGMFWMGTSSKSIGLQGVDNQTEKQNVNDFYNQSDEDQLSVAKEIGIDNWRSLHSNSIWIASAILKIPFKNKIRKFKNVVLILAICGAIIERILSKKNTYGNLQIREVITSNNLPVYNVIFGVIVFLPIVLGAKILRRISNKVSRNYKIVYDRTELKSIRDANKWVSNLCNDF